MRSWLWIAGVGLLAALTTFAPLLGASPSESALAHSLPQLEDTEEHPGGPLNLTDHRFVVWLVARNAQTLGTRPWRLFDAEPCHPAKNALAAGEPGATLGLLAVPLAWLGASPVARFNFAFLAATLAAYLAMTLLVREWTGSAVAAACAGLLYAFHAIKLSDVIHIYVWDMAWTVFALWLARRFFVSGRLRDAAGLSLVCALQIGSSFYPLLAAAVLALPFLVWLFARNGRGQARWHAWLLVSAVVLAASVWLLGPYLAGTGEGALVVRSNQYYRPLSWFAPGRHGFPGVSLLLLVGAAFAIGRGGLRRELGDPRAALAVGGLLCLLLAIGGWTGADVLILRDGEHTTLWNALAAVLPGLDVVRSPGSLVVGAHLVAALLAGIGAAALLARVPARYASVAGAVLLALVFVDTLRPLGLPTRDLVRTVSLAPPPEQVAFYRALPGEGALFEIPVRRKNLGDGSAGTLLSAYHGRRTSRCYYPKIVPEELEALSREMPTEAALERLVALGFDTVVLHHPPGDLFGPARQRRFREFVKRTRLLSLETESAEATGYRIALRGQRRPSARRASDLFRVARREALREPLQ